MSDYLAVISKVSGDVRVTSPENGLTDESISQGFLLYDKDRITTYDDSSCSLVWLENKVTNIIRSNRSVEVRATPSAAEQNKAFEQSIKGNKQFQFHKMGFWIVPPSSVASVKG